MVSREEYPISGGNETTKMSAHSTSQPAVTSRHFFA